MEQTKVNYGGTFLEIARQVARKLEFVWCPCCGDRTDQTYERDEGIFEVYRCERCHGLHYIAVR